MRTYRGRQMYRVMLLTLAGAARLPVTTASAAECTRAVAQGRTFEDPVGDSGNAPDLGIVWVNVDAELRGVDHVRAGREPAARLGLPLGDGR